MRNAERAGRWLASNHMAVIGSVGVSGGLSPGIGKGDLVLADEIVHWTDKTYERVWKSDASFLNRLCGALEEDHIPVQLGKILTTKGPALTVREKAAHFRESGALAIDMESAGVAGEANNAGIPFFAMRGVSDPADMPIPNFVPDGVDSKGDIRLGYLCALLVKNPFGVMGLLRLQRGFNLAMRHLKAAWEGPLRRVLLNGMAPSDRA